MADAALGHSARRASILSGSARIAVGVDVLVAVLLLVGLLLVDRMSGVVTHVGVPAHAVRIVGYVVACGAIPCRRRCPWSALAAATMATVVALALGGPDPTTLCVVITAYSAAAAPAAPTVGWWGPPALIGVAVAGALIIGQAANWLRSFFPWAAIACVGWFAGLAARERRSRLAAAEEQRAEQDRQRAADLRQAAMDERLVIARELHDVVAHAMSVIAVRAGVARVVMDDDPVEVKEALGIIETTTRRALQEMRLLVGVLRRDGDIDAELVPAPGLADLDVLVEQIKRAEVDVSVQVRGVPRPLPAGVDLSAYRIAQEALTNVVRHAGPTAAVLTIDYRPEELTVEVIDAGPGVAGPPLRERRTDSGHGLIGMAERVALFGGQLDAAPSGPGFRLRALLRTDQEHT
jgi:signal transduction histidine kinase